MNHVVPSRSTKSNQVAFAKGSFISLHDGRNIYDAGSGAVNVNVGYGDEQVIERMMNTSQRLSYSHSSGNCEEQQMLEERLHRDWLPAGFQVANFCTTGAESVELAMKMALEYNEICRAQRTRKFLAMKVSYHGASLSILGVGGQRYIYRSFLPYLASTDRLLHEIAESDIRAPEDLALEELRAALADDPDQYAAFVFEPVCGSSGGGLVSSLKFWKMVTDLCRDAGIPIIADETMTGFGRTGFTFGFEGIDVEPDFIAAGKGLAAGYAAITMVAAKREIVEALGARNCFFMTSTMSAQPAAFAASDEVLGILSDKKCVKTTNSRGIKLKERFGDLARAPRVQRISGDGLLWGIELDQHAAGVCPDETRESIRLALFDRGIRIYPAGLETDRAAFLFSPPLTSTDVEISDALDALEEVLK